MARPKGSKNKPRSAPTSVAQVVDVSDTSPSDIEKLKKQVADLEKQLASEKEKRGEAEQQALEAAQAQMYIMGAPVEEVPTGQKIKIKVLDKYEVVGHRDDGREILKARFRTEEVPTFYYKIDMPPVGGMDLKINGQPFYHGSTYKFDVNTLRTVKDMIHRIWAHDRDIHGSDENFYRKKQSPTLNMRSGRVS